jgi:uncharacterized protein YlzI (FlbEa/FlbD family)
MKLIKLTSIKNATDFYINIEHIGHMNEVNETISYGKVDTPKHTVVGVTTHNNGGFRVKETVEEIIQLIELTKNKQQ